MPNSGDFEHRLGKLEFEFQGMKDTLMGDMQNPGGALGDLKLMREDLKEVKEVTKSLSVDRTRLFTAIAVSISLGTAVGKYFFK